MKIVNGSLSFVILGDWNKYYLTPAWLAQNVFSVEKVEIELNLGQGPAYSANIKNDGVSVQPTQDRIIFSCNDFDEAKISNFENAYMAFLRNASSPQIKAFGFNVQFIEEDVRIFSEVIDNLPDSDRYIEAGVTLQGTQIVRNMSYNDKEFSITFAAKGAALTISVNMNKECGFPSSEIEVGSGAVNSFLADAKNILSAGGYVLEEEEE